MYTKSNTGIHLIKSFCLNFLKQSPNINHFIRKRNTNTISVKNLYSELINKVTKEISAKIKVIGYIPNIIFLITLYFVDVVKCLIFCKIHSENVLLGSENT